MRERKPNGLLHSKRISNGPTFRRLFSGIFYVSVIIFSDPDPTSQLASDPDPKLNFSKILSISFTFDFPSECGNMHIMTRYKLIS
jgi:hypothetical protein